MSILAVKQVIIGSDREMCRLFQLLSQEFCLVLPGTNTKWTVNDDGGVCAIFLVCTREALSSSLLLRRPRLLKRVGSLLNDFSDKVIDYIDIKLPFLTFDFSLCFVNV
jgi:2-keto-3-deoxy-galactonokinase